MSAEFQGKYFGTLFQESSVSGHQQRKEFLSFEFVYLKHIQPLFVQRQGSNSTEAYPQ